MKAILIQFVVAALTTTAFGAEVKVLTCSSGEEFGPIHLVDVYQTGTNPQEVKVVFQKRNYDTAGYDKWGKNGVMTADASNLSIRIFRSAIPGGGGNTGINPFSGGVVGKRAKGARILAYDATATLESASYSASVYCFRPFSEAQGR
ncbi:MAG: hypothetical protein ABL958_09395 [Bdellovibrionia bacterium]